MKIFSTFGNAYYKPYHGSDHGKSTSKIIPIGVHAAIYNLIEPGKFQRGLVFNPFRAYYA